VTVDVDGLGPVLFCHGAPGDDEACVTARTPAARLRELFGGVDERVVVVGHTHEQFDRVEAGRRIVNPGSIGHPAEQASGAYWAVFGPDVDLRRTPYDVADAARRIRATGYPSADDYARDVLEPAAVAARNGV
jgi:diadenosine tetraphosphatase ApaH/serine/threonine PP2A family protein phosphatase